MPLSDFPYWELKPRALSKEEMENPMQVLHDFYSYSHLPDVRDQLWEFLKTAVTGSYCTSLNRRERCDMFYFFEKLEKLVEATHVLTVQNPKVID